MTTESWLLLADLLVGTGVFGLLFRLNFKWNTMIDRLDNLWEAYCEEHSIPFKPLGNGRGR